MSISLIKEEQEHIIRVLPILLKKDSKNLVIIGEGKVNLSKNKVDEFIKKKLKRLDGVFDETFPVLVIHMISQHDVEIR
ncbi:MAG: hypothetical protein AB1630_08650 [bacterium]